MALQDKEGNVRFTPESDIKLILTIRAANDPEQALAGVSEAFHLIHTVSSGGNLMNAEKVNTYLSLSANIGVVIGLVLLIVEISQNTDMMRAPINQSRTDSAMSEQQATYNSEYIPAILVKRNNGEPLSDEDMQRYGPFLRSFNRNMDNQLWQYDQELLGENIPRSIRSGVRSVIGEHDVSIAWWDRHKFTFTDAYVAFVEEAIADLR